MSGDLSVSMELPVMKVRYLASLHQVKRASGLEYLVMKMVEIGQTIGSQDLDIQHMMGVFSMHSDLFPLVLDEINRLRNVGMLRHNLSRIDQTTPIRRISITETGEELLGKNITASERKSVDKVIVYCPWKTDKFAPDYNIAFLEKRMRIPFGKDKSQEAIDHIGSHRFEFGIDPDATIKNPRIDTADAPMGMAECQLRVYFDASERIFRPIPAQGLDIEYIAGTCDSAKIIRGLPPAAFEIPGARFEVKRWADSPPEGCEWILPWDLDLGSGVLFYGPDISKVSREDAAKLPEGFGCDAMVVSSERQGMMCWFVRIPVSVEGFEGSAPARLVAFKRMTKKEIDSAVGMAIAGKRISHADELAALDRTARALGDDGILVGRVIGSLTPGDLDSLRKALANISGLNREVSKLADALDETLSIWVTDGLALSDAAKFAEICARRGYPLKGEKSLPRIFKAYGAAAAAEWAYSAGTPPESFESRSDLIGAITASIISGKPLPGNSKEMGPARQAAESMGTLMRITGIRSPETYRLDPESIEGESGKEIDKAQTALSQSMASVLVRYHAIAQNASWAKIEGLAAIFHAIADSVRRKPKTESEFAAEENGFLFCRWLRWLAVSRIRKLEGDGLEEEILRSFRTSGRMTLADYAEFDRFLAFSDSCLGEDVLRTIDPAQRAAWAELVFAIIKLKRN